MRIFVIIVNVIAILFTLLGEARVSKYTLVVWQISSFVWAMIAIYDGKVSLVSIENVNVIDSDSKND